MDPIASSSSSERRQTPYLKGSDEEEKEKEIQNSEGYSPKLMSFGDQKESDQGRFNDSKSSSLYLPSESSSIVSSSSSRLIQRANCIEDIQNHIEIIKSNSLEIPNWQMYEKQGGEKLVYAVQKPVVNPRNDKIC